MFEALDAVEAQGTEAWCLDKRESPLKGSSVLGVVMNFVLASFSFAVLEIGFLLLAGFVVDKISHNGISEYWYHGPSL